MNPDFPQNPREELEARITAMLLGELSEAEAAALQTEIEASAELIALQARLRQAISLLHQAATEPPSQKLIPPELPRISDERRATLQKWFRTAPPVEPKVAQHRFDWRTPLKLAAMFILLLGFSAILILPNFVKARTSAQRSPADESGRRVAEWARVKAFPAPAMNAPAEAGSDGREDSVALKPNQGAKLESDFEARYGFAGRRAGAAIDPLTGLPSAGVEIAPTVSESTRGGGEGRQFSRGRQIALPQIEAKTPELGQNGIHAGDSVLAPILGDSPSLGVRFRQRSDENGGAESQLGFGVNLSGAAGEQVATAAPPTQEHYFDVDGAARSKDGVGQTTRDFFAKTETRLPATPPAAGPAAAASEPQSGGAYGGGRMGGYGNGWYFSRGYAGAPPPMFMPLPSRPTFGRELGELTDKRIAGKPFDPADELTLPRGDRPPLERLVEERKEPAQAAGAPEQAGVPLNFYKGANAGFGIAGHPEDAVAVADLENTEQLTRGIDSMQRSQIPDDRSKEMLVEELEDLRTARDQVLRRLANFDNGSSLGRTGLPKSETADRELESLAKKSTELKQQMERVERQIAQEMPPAAAKPAAQAPIPQPEVMTAANAFSTFSLNVSDVSFKLAAASLEKGALPEAASIRSEEFINAFDYRDPEPSSGAPVAFAWERARYPFAHDRDLLRFSAKVAAIGRAAGRPLNLVLLLDSSGSMERADRVQIIQQCLRTLAAQLQPQDRVSVVAFARTARLWVDGLEGSKANELAARVGNLAPEGGTNLEEAMDVAYRTAFRHFMPEGVNRVVLLTDGAANLGNVDPASLKQKVEAHRRQGIALDCFGIGWEGLNDDLLETLSRNGDGRYGFVNTPEAAASEFAGQLAGALKVAASDVKAQVEFNSRRVTAYRQIGYAKHQLTKEQFRDNTVDAAELAAAEAGNALYVVHVNPAGEGPIATVRVRFKVPGTSDYREHEWTVPYDGAARALEQSSPAMRVAAVASAFSEFLAASPYAGEVTSDRLLNYLQGAPEKFGADPRPKKLEAMIRQAQSLAGK